MNWLYVLTKKMSEEGRTAWGRVSYHLNGDESERDGHHWQWIAVALRSDGYHFYGRGTDEASALAELNAHLGDAAPAYPPMPQDAIAADVQRSVKR